MTVIRSLLRYGLLFFVLIVSGVVVFLYYPWIFSKTVQGEIIEVERITNPTAVLGRSSEAQMYSYAVLIQDVDGTMHTSSSEDRQWQVAKKGYCAVALFYRYPPWDLNHAGTFFNARLQKIYKCPGKAAPEDPLPTDGDPNAAPPSSEPAL